jgi:hypothetical protein
MFEWFRTRLQKWARRVQQKEIERLLEENRSLKKIKGCRPIRHGLM